MAKSCLKRGEDPGEKSMEDSLGRGRGQRRLGSFKGKGSETGKWYLLRSLRIKFLSHSPYGRGRELTPTNFPVTFKSVLRFSVAPPLQSKEIIT